MYILGAGMSGCIAAILNAQAIVLEASPVPPTNHNAVLRFRTDAISKITGIPFKKVTVHKAIYADGGFQSPNPKLANEYSKKVTGGKILSRSIWNTDTVERFVAPPDFHQRMLDVIGDRVKYGLPITHITTDGIYGNEFQQTRIGRPIISTLPMPVLSNAIGVYVLEDFSRQEIHTARYKIDGCNANQTIYFPGPETSVYRATITINELILEATSSIESWDIAAVQAAFSLNDWEMQEISRGSQQYGKIAPVDDAVRKAFMFEATTRFGVYSLGRFAVWKNILLDDVYDDVFAIRRMIEQSNYDLRKEM